MRTFALTSSYTGAVYVTYDDNGNLRKLDLTEADLTPVQITWFHNCTPLVMEETAWQAFLAKGRQKAIEVFQEVTFDDFYKAFGVKEARKKAENAWNKMSKAEQLRAYNYIPRFKSQKKVSEQAMPYPASYLNQARWSD